VFQNSCIYQREKVLQEIFGEFRKLFSCKSLNIECLFVEFIERLDHLKLPFLVPSRHMSSCAHVFSSL
jgi:hypothetical protein